MLKYIDPHFKRYTSLDRGSDERQYCAPGVDLPIATIMRSKYGQFPKYHTSLDDLVLVTPRGLEGGFCALRQALEVIEANVHPKVTVCCEPQLGWRGLYQNLSAKYSRAGVKDMMNVISYCDGKRNLIDIADIVGQPAAKVSQYVDLLSSAGLVSTRRLQDRPTEGSAAM